MTGSKWRGRWEEEEEGEEEEQWSSLRKTKKVKRIHIHVVVSLDSMKEKKFKMQKRNWAASFQSPSFFVVFSAVFLYILHLFLWTQFQERRRRVVTQAEIWRFEVEKELKSEKVEKQGQRYEGNKIRHRHIFQDSSRVSWEKEKVSFTHTPD